MRTLAPVLAVLVLLASSVAAAAPLSATLVSVGLEATGGARATADFRGVFASAPPGEIDLASAVLEISGPSVVVTETWIDNVGTPATLVRRPDGGGERTTDLGAATLRLDAVAPADPVRILAGAVGDVSRGTLTVPAAPLAVSALVDWDGRLWTGLGEPDPTLVRGVRVDGPLVASAAHGGEIEWTGDLMLHLYGVDVREAGGEGRVYRSGVLRVNGSGGNPLAPDGLAYEARTQVLDVAVKGGVLRMTFPRVETVAGQVAAYGSTWDAADAHGSLAWGDTRHELDGTSVRLVGDLQATIAAGDGFIESAWSGTATAVDLASTPLVVAPVNRATGGLWTGVAVVGAVLLGAAGFAVRRARSGDAFIGAFARGNPQAALAAADRALRRGRRVEDARIAKAAALLRLGRPREVVALLLAQPFDPRTPSAAVHAFLIGAAHAQEGEADAARLWFTRAAAIDPAFEEAARRGPEAGYA